jgi:uncharacterized protein YkwD
MNRLRGAGGPCQATQALPPLKPLAALERVARDLARGAELKQSEKENGYRAIRSRTVKIEGDQIGVQAEAILARTEYCAHFRDAQLTEAGFFLDERRFWILLAAPFAPPAAQSQQEAGQRVLDLVNLTRAVPRNCGERAFGAAPPVRWNDTLAAASRLHAEDMARHNYISHSGRDGSSPAQRVERAGYRYRNTGENIAGGARMQADDAVAGWIKSPGHCANLMNPAYTEMGAAFAVNAASELGIYWAQAFGSPR